MPEANSTLCFSHMWRSSYRTAWGWKSQGCLRWPHRHFGIRDRFCPSATAGNYEIKDLLQVLTYLSFDSKHMHKKGMSDDRKINFWMELLVLPPTNTRFMMTEHIFCCGCLLLLFIFTCISLNTYDIKEKKKDSCFSLVGTLCFCTLNLLFEFSLPVTQSENEHSGKCT